MKVAVFLNDEQVKALDDSAWKPLELIEDTYDARYKYKINTSDLKDTSYNVYVKAQDNCNGETAFFSTSKLVVDTPATGAYSVPGYHDSSR